MSHITNDDFSKGNVQEIEYYAHHLHKDPEPVQIYLDRIKKIASGTKTIKEADCSRDQKRVLNLFRNIAICSTELKHPLIYMVDDL